MSVYESYKRKMKVDSCSTGKSYPTLGEKLKSDSDQLMELTWDGDLQSKVAYIYDYFHDDFFTDEHGITRSLASGMTYENTKKTPIDIKFIIKSYQSMDKDEVEHVFDNSNEDITTKYTNAEFIWTCNIGDEDWTEKVTWRNGTEFNQRKVKFPNDVSMIGKIINVQCTIRTGNTAIQPTTIQLELTE